MKPTLNPTFARLLDRELPRPAHTHGRAGGVKATVRDLYAARAPRLRGGSHRAGSRRTIENLGCITQTQVSIGARACTPCRRGARHGVRNTRLSARFRRKTCGALGPGAVGATGVGESHGGGGVERCTRRQHFFADVTLTTQRIAFPRVPQPYSCLWCDSGCRPIYELVLAGFSSST